MAFSNKSDDSAMSEINVTPLVDVMLVLLIIFIVTAPLMTQSINVNLPETQKDLTDDKPPEEHQVTVELDLKGQLTLTKMLKGVEEKQVFQTATDKDKITAALHTLLEKDKDVILAFSADAKAPHGEVMKIMQQAENVGILKLSFLTLEEH
jgi:biopolymer transport protein TolR